jgi:4-hydroxybenzoate polyprenyltransferase
MGCSAGYAFHDVDTDKSKKQNVVVVVVVTDKMMMMMILLVLLLMMMILLQWMNQKNVKVVDYQD